ncbi:MAG: DUF2442 domain-containing protein [Neisseriaceae bacterium]
MYWDVISVEVLDAYKIKVKFSDNLEGVVDISKKWLTGVFAPLIDMKIFEKVYVGKESSAVTWDIDGEPIDLAPDTMYNEIKNNNGIYVLK